MDIEGLKYRVRHAKRVRWRVGIVSAGQHLAAAAVALSMSDSDGIT